MRKNPKEPKVSKKSLKNYESSRKTLSIAKSQDKIAVPERTRKLNNVKITKRPENYEEV